jgi:hypothetical protein
MASFARTLTLSLLLGSAVPAGAAPVGDLPQGSRSVATRIVPVQLGISRRPSDYANGYGTNAANSTAVTPITPYGGYVVNQYGYGNYVSGPLGYGGYPAGSAGAEIWRQREHWKCEYAPETC